MKRSWNTWRSPEATCLIHPISASARGAATSPLWQAHHVRDLIAAAGGTSEIIVLSTQGDREQVQSFEKLEGKGFFTKEIEDALLEGRIDIAVHSHKDLETQQPPGLTIAAVPARASQRDTLLIQETNMSPPRGCHLHQVRPSAPPRFGAGTNCSCCGQT